jgi:hypothetical protein
MEIPKPILSGAPTPIIIIVTIAEVSMVLLMYLILTE